MLSVALTGNIGAGKSTVTELFRRWGATIIDADELVHQAQAPGQPILAQLANRFGTDLLTRDGTLDRAALRARVLADPEALADLNAIVHPEVHRRRLELLAEARHRGDQIVVSVIPLLFEAAATAEFDAVVLVDAPERVRRARLLATRAMPASEIERLIAAQLPSRVKRSRSDYVIENDADLPALERQTLKVWKALIARA
jgi:dephospho-CoA kinase